MGFPQRPLSLHRFSYAENNPVNHTDPSGHFIDTALDVGFLAYDVYTLANNWRQGCDLTWDWIALGADIVGMAIPGVTGLGLIAHGDDAARLLRAASTLSNAPDIKRILVVGENSFDYTASLYNRLRKGRKPFELTGTSLETAQNLMRQGFTIPAEVPGLAIRHGVDATNLAAAFSGKQFDAILFNNPHILKGSATGQATAELIRDFGRSAWKQLAPGGEIHIVVTRKLVDKYDQVAQALSQSTKQQLFGQSEYFASYRPRYTSGEGFFRNAEWQWRVKNLYDFVFTKK